MDARSKNSAAILIFTALGGLLFCIAVSLGIYLVNTSRPNPADAAQPTSIPSSPTSLPTVPPSPVPTLAPRGLAILHHFTSQPGDGRIPYGVLVLSNGAFYGTTTYGGPPYDSPPANPANKGNIFRMNLDGSGFIILHEFRGGADDGWKPWSGLSISDNVIYGSTVYGGPHGEEGGVLYALDTDGSGFRVLHAFGGPGDGYGASTSPVQVGDSLYGMTRWGGLGTGTIYRYEIGADIYTQLYRFAADGRDGSSPLGTLTPANDDYLYGLTWLGGLHNMGTLFRIQPDGSDFETLHHFSGGAQGKYPYDTLAFDGLHTFYGTTLGEYGPVLSEAEVNDPSDLGTIFKYDLSTRAYTVLHTFTGGTYDSGKPNGSVALSPDGRVLYGTTHGDAVWGGAEFGVLYRMNTDGTGFEIIHEFSGGPAGDTPMRTPLLLDGILCGMTAFGGAENYGTIYCYAISNTDTP